MVTNTATVAHDAYTVENTKVFSIIKLNNKQKTTKNTVSHKE